MFAWSANDQNGPTFVQFDRPIFADPEFAATGTSWSIANDDGSFTWSSSNDPTIFAPGNTIRLPGNDTPEGPATPQTVSFTGDPWLIDQFGRPVPPFTDFPWLPLVGAVPTASHFTEDESVVCTFDLDVFSTLEATAGAWVRRNNLGTTKVFGNLYELQVNANTVTLTTHSPGATVGLANTVDYNGPDSLVDFRGFEVPPFADFPCPLDPA